MLPRSWAEAKKVETRGRSQEMFKEQVRIP